MFLVGIPLAGLAFVCAVLLKETPLHDSVSREQGAADDAAPATAADQDRVPTPTSVASGPALAVEADWRPTVELAGATAIVTGGASGIGRGHGGAAARRGGPRGGARRPAGIGARPSSTSAATSRSRTTSSTAVGQVHDAFGGLDVAVLNAGVGGFGSLVDLSSAEWDRVLGVNLRGTFLCLREVGKAMVAGGRGGAIVAVSSISGFLADRMMGHYSVSKAGVAELVRVAARELGPFGIRVNAVAPGTTDTPMFASTKRLPGYRERVAERAALGEVGTPDGVARAIRALLELDWVTGQVLAADGGVSLWSPIDPAEGMGT